MRTRTLGKTEIELSELCLGTWGLSGDGYGSVKEEDARAVVGMAMELGIAAVDTSPAYAKGRMETILGEELGKTDAGKQATVISRHGVDRRYAPARKRFDANFLRESVEQSLGRLKREKLDILLLHNPSVSAMFSDELLELMQELKSQGRIGHWGVSAGSVEVAQAAMDREAELISLSYNVLHPQTLHTLAEEIQETQVGVLVHSVLAYGLLAGTWHREREFPVGDHRKDRWTQAEMRGRFDHLSAVRSLLGGDVFTMRAAALRFALSADQVTSVILGPKTTTQLQQLVREAGEGPPYLEEEKLARLPAKLEEVGVTL